MLTAALYFAFTAVTAALALDVLRLILGPNLPDRILALDTLYINSIALLMLVGIHLGSAIFFEGALLIAMMGFVGTVAFCKHVTGRSVIE
jgi:multicomponent K+:H+ antiporter subunit F